MNTHDDAMEFLHALQATEAEFRGRLSQGLMIDLAESWLANTKMLQQILDHHRAGEPRLSARAQVKAPALPPPEASGERWAMTNGSLHHEPGAEGSDFTMTRHPEAEAPAPRRRGANPRQVPPTVDPSGQNRPGQMVYIPEHVRLSQTGKAEMRPGHWRFRPDEQRPRATGPNRQRRVDKGVARGSRA